MNVPLPEGYGDADLWAACAQVVLPAARRFRPDLILVSAGFDAVTGDPLGGCSVSPRCFGAITHELKLLAQELCRGRLLLALEGGYTIEALRDCVGEVAQTLSWPLPDVRSEAFSRSPSWFGAELPA